jgi:hypothetical protein
MAVLADSVLQGHATGDIKIVSLTNDPCEEMSVQDGVAVNCACTVGADVWIGVGCSIFKTSFLRGELMLKVINISFVLFWFKTLFLLFVFLSPNWSMPLPVVDIRALAHRRLRADQGRACAHRARRWQW